MANNFFKSSCLSKPVKHSSRVVFLATLLLSELVSFAQINSGLETVSLTAITVLNPGIRHEQKIGRLQTVCVHAYMTALKSASYSGVNGFDVDFHLNPALSLQARHYYNAARRLAKGKAIERNSMNYVSVLIKTEISNRKLATGFYPATRHRPIITSGFVWGFQRNYNSRFSLDVNFGAGYLFETGRVYDGGEIEKINTSGFTTVGQVSLGFWLNKR